MARFCGAEWWRLARGKGCGGTSPLPWPPGRAGTQEIASAGIGAPRERGAPLFSFHEHTVTAYLEHDAGGKVIAGGEEVA